MGTDDKSMNVFLTFIGLGISAAVVQCAIIQNTIQKDNIKIQLLKRSEIFHTKCRSGMFEMSLVSRPFIGLGL